jgi:hypothetical protein
MRGVNVPAAGSRRWPFALGLILAPPAGQDTAGIPVLTGGDGSRAGQDDAAGAAGSWAWDGRMSRYLAVALATYRAGYFLLHILEATPGQASERDEPESQGRPLGFGAGDWARLRGLTMRTDADALFVLGASFEQVAALEPMATELRLTLHRAEPAAGLEGPGIDITRTGPGLDRDDGGSGVGSARGARC